MPYYQRQPEEPSAAKFPSFSSGSRNRLRIKREETPPDLPDWSPSPVDTVAEPTYPDQFHTSTPLQNPKLVLPSLTSASLLKGGAALTRSHCSKIKKSGPEAMPSSPKVPKLALGAGAAELKENIAQGKGGNVISPTRFVPHPLPRIPTQTTVDASAHDIAALITSISSNLADNGKQAATNSQDQTSGPAARPRGINRPSVPNGTSVSNSGVSASGVAEKVETAPSHQAENVSQRLQSKGVGSAGSSAVNSATWSSTNQRAGQSTNIQAVHSTNRAREPPKINQLANSGGTGKSDESDNRKDGTAEQPQEITTNTAPVKVALDHILDNDADLRDWLVLTNYYDVEARNRKLTRHRRAKALAAERERIEEEERKLMEEEALEMGFRAPIAPQLKGETPLQTPVSQPSSSVFSMPATAETTVEQEPIPVIPAKRAHSPDRESREEGLARPEKMARREAASTQPTEPMKADAKYEDDQSGRDTRKSSQQEPRLLPPMRESSPRTSYRASPSHREYSPKRTVLEEPPRGPHDQSAADKSHVEYDSYRGDGVRVEYQRESSPHRGGRQFTQRRPTSASQALDLGGPGETRFFIIKSFNEENVRKCMVDGVWATQTRNGQILTRAFASCKNVILFFSINKSRAFQGFARMSTTPSPDTPRPGWMKLIHWDSSPPFRVEWLSTVPVVFSRVHSLVNEYNDSLPVLVGKDGQEVEERCGRDLLRIMQDTAAANAGRSGGGGSQSAAAPREEQTHRQGTRRGGSPGPAGHSTYQKQKPWYPSHRGKQGGFREGYRGGGEGGGGSGYRQDRGKGIKQEHMDISQ